MKFLGCIFKFLAIPIAFILIAMITIDEFGYTFEGIGLIIIQLIIVISLINFFVAIFTEG